MKASKGKLSKPARILFSRQLALALNSDITITEAMSILVCVRGGGNDGEDLHGLQFWRCN